MEHTNDTTIPPEHPSSATHARRAILAGLGTIAAGALLTRNAHAGPLTPPPGPIEPTPGPEPRIPIGPTTTPGNNAYQFAINQPGSYYLTKPITGATAQSGILIAADNVTLDLMGFELAGVPGSNTGIVILGSRNSIRIHNGIVRNWGAGGIDLTATFAGRNIIIEHIIARSNGGNGFFLPSGTIIRHCSASQNTANGIRVGQNCIISDCIATQNSADGFFLSPSCSITRCIAAQNTVIGITTAEACVVTHCVAYNNNARGISLGEASLVTDCTASFNTNPNNSAYGIFAVVGSIIRNNTLEFNSIGLLAFGRNLIESNISTKNLRGIVISGDRNFIARNVCSENTVANWEVAAGNACLVVQASTSTAFIGNAGGASPGSTNPNANYTI